MSRQRPSLGTIACAALLLAVSCCGIQRPPDASARPAAGPLRALAVDPEASAATAALVSASEDPSVLRSLKRVLVRRGRRLTRFQKSYLRLGVLTLSPRAVQLGRELESGRVRGSRRAQLWALLLTLNRNPAVRALVRRGEWLKRHPKHLRSLLNRIGGVAASVQPPTFGSRVAAAIASPGGRALVSRLGPLDLALLLPSNRLIGLRTPRRAARLSAVGRIAPLREEWAQSGGLTNRELLEQLFKHPATGLAILRDRAQKWLTANEGVVKRRLGKTAKKWLLDKLGLGLIVPLKDFIDGHREEIERLRDKFDPTKRFPPEVQPPSASTDGCATGSTLAASQAPPRAQDPSDGSVDQPRQSAEAGSSGLPGSSGCPGAEAGRFEIVTAELKPAIPGASFVRPLRAQGGTPPYEWQVVDGSLPAGVGLTADGTLWGNAHAFGQTQVTVEASDQGGSSEVRSYQLVLLPPDCPGGFPCALAAGLNQVTVAWTHCGGCGIEPDGDNAYLLGVYVGGARADPGSWLVCYGTSHPCYGQGSRRWYTFNGYSTIFSFTPGSEVAVDVGYGSNSIGEDAPPPDVTSLGTTNPVVVK